MKQFTSIHDVENVEALIEKALFFKQNPIHSYLGERKVLGMVFFNPSLRTRMSTQKAAYNLGMDVIALNAGADGWAIETKDGVIMDGDKPEHINEAVQIMSSYCDLLAVRTFAGLQNRLADYSEAILTKFIQLSKVPILSLESATLHPLQSLTDMMTIRELDIKKPKVVLTWAPHPKALPQAVPNSFLQWVTKSDAEVVVTHPEGYELDIQFSQDCKIEYDQNKALEGADIVYAKNWSSYSAYGHILSTDRSWTVTKEKMALTNNASFMHCLPLRRNMIATDEVVNDSVVINQAGNRVWAAQAVLNELLNYEKENQNINEQGRFAYR
ncbi:N-acetylornithine carbamoyltransferase [Mangrovivirga cuniculi]|uniref:N-succinylornithine carbamoyltransferase n=1 Tax=Mangrovivirga cuniculi TaxID=2715131 RepID=A0A4D7JK31_9BACT|nr:N-acetylornithine carbamoyltransferase [Mangrovivirga cuniculi]QCK16309.1 N-acetylornithine carbamoyltransferase [Mangrovivirga cuniculi]